MYSISANLAKINQRLADTVSAAGRKADSVRLVAVSKFHPQEAVTEALKAGHRLFGENRVQEAKSKYPDLRTTYPDLELHLIGPLQTNKADDAVKIFDVIETLDRPQLATALAKAMKKLSRHLPCLVEVNIGNEPQKAGIAPERLGEFLKFCCDNCGLKIVGLMCIPPQNEDPKPHFKKLRQLAEQHHLPEISMGMSGDFEQAIQEGATIVRVGTAIFGERIKP